MTTSLRSAVKPFLASSLIALSSSSAFAIGVAILAPSPNVVTEGDTTTFTIATDAPVTGAALVVDLKIGAFSTATLGSDFTLPPGGLSVTIPVGESTAEFTIDIFDDIIPIAEADETVTIDLDVSGGLGLDYATVTIVDNDTPPTVSITASTATTAEGGKLTYTVSRAVATTAALTVFLDVPTGTATTDVDYTGAVTQVIIPADSAFTTFDIQTVTDGVIDPDETVNMSLLNDPAYTIDVASATGTITDTNTPGVTNVSTDGDASEGAPLSFRITRDPDFSAVPIIFTYTVSGTATLGSDFVAPSGSVLLPAGQAEALVTITTIDDVLVEVPESVTLTLTGSSPVVSLGTLTATANIVDNEAGQEVSISTTTPQVEEGGMIDFLVERAGDPTAALVVILANGGSATDGTDHTTQPTSVTLPAGSSSATVSLNVKDDSSKEKNETVIASIVADAAYTIAVGGESATATISDAADRNRPSVRIKAIDSDASENGDSGRFRVYLSKKSSTAITVLYKMGGTATNGEDYKTRSGSVKIPAGRKFANFQIVPIDDGTRESTEKARARLKTDNSQYFLRGKRADKVLIKDNDAPDASGTLKG